MAIINPYTLKIALKELVNTQNSILKDNVTDDIADVIINHSLGAAAAGLGSAWIPGIGGTAALFASVGFIWSMYFRINKCLGLKLSKTLLKSLASAIITNIAASAASVIGGAAVSTVLSFIPGIGTVTASIIMAGVVYAAVFASGLIYIKLLTSLFKAGKDPSKMTEEQLKSAAASAVKESDVSKIIKDAKKDYVSARKSGSVNGDEKVDLEKDD
ncbi:MAG: hypothetical protein K0S41_2691 [Anaerocolumna sp.]|jgi:uncharacterized protein (DUF697 family)|nr:hypothetical protein [Anaerocolumna sp.]